MVFSFLSEFLCFFLEEFTTVVIPSGVLTDDEQLQVFKAITITTNTLSCGKFRRRQRKGCKFTEISVNDVLYPNNNNPNMFYQWVDLQSETLSVKANKRIMIKSISIKPRFQQKSHDNCNVNVNIKIETVTPIHNAFGAQFERSHCSTVHGKGNDTVNVTFQGKSCKVPIEKLISNTEMLVLTIKPYVTIYNLQYLGSNQPLIQLLLHANQRYNGMMYSQDLSQQTTLYMTLTGGHLVKSFEIMELC